MKPYLYDELSPVDRRTIREMYVKEQNGLCCHCKEPLTGDPRWHEATIRINWGLFPPNFLRYPIHLHHDRKTGLTIGAVHARCNAYLWEHKGE